MALDFLKSTIRMKTSLLRAAIVTVVASGSLAIAQVSTTTASVQTYSGNVVSFTPGSFTVSTGVEAEPTAYTYTKETQFVDPDGNVVSYESVRRDTPVRVEYVTDGEVRRVQRVVVLPAAAATSTTTTTTTITE